MITEKPHVEPSMDEILASIRKIISADSQEEAQRTHAFFSTDESDDILDLTDLLPEELGNAQTPAMASEFHLNDLGEWSSLTDKPIYFEELEKNSHDGGEKPFSYGPTPAPSFEDSLLSQTTISETANAFHLLDKLTQGKPKSSEIPLSEGMGGQTLENLMKEMLKPLLKEWLDAHLPSVVRSVVTQQVEKIVGQKRA